MDTVDSVGLENEEKAPIFFLSHAHPPAPPTRRRREPGPRGPVGRLFELLWEHLGEMVSDADKSADLGMMDSRIWLGENWQIRLSVELARCNVFVPVMSRRFFDSSWCGKEWGVFERRGARLRESGTPTERKAIVPVHWVPLGQRPMPEFASQYQRWDADFPDTYQQLGLYALMARPALRSDADDSIYLLAERIKTVSEEIVTDIVAPVDLNFVENRFEESTGTFHRMLSSLDDAKGALPAKRSAPAILTGTERRSTEQA